MKRLRHCAILGVLVLSACSSKASSPVSAEAQYLYLWTASDDAAQPDFLAVLDVTEDGRPLRPPGDDAGRAGRTNGPHHTEHEMPADGQLFANGFKSGQSFVFDLTNPKRPRVAHQFGDLEDRTRTRSSGCPMATSWPRSRCATSRRDAPGGYRGAHASRSSRAFELSERSGTDPALRVYSGGIVPPWTGS